jgi:hypothetical protein
VCAIVILSILDSVSIIFLAQCYQTLQDSGTFSFHIEGCSDGWRGVLLLTSPIWKNYCTCGNFSCLGHFATYFYAYFSNEGTFHIPQGNLYIFGGMNHIWTFGTLTRKRRSLQKDGLH